MEFRVLGPVEVVDGASPVAIPGTKPRILLARLLADAGTVVSVDAITDALWPGDDDLPERPASAVQVYVSNLRRALGAGPIRTVAPGYELDLTGHSCDAATLADLVATARQARTEGRLDDAVAAARRAVELPRGEPYADVAYEEWAQGIVRQLRETIVAAHEELHAALLALGEEGAAIPELEALVAAHPFREQLRGLLMLALYRTGRQGDALRTYAEGRSAMVEELGVEPGSELRQLEQRILAQDPALARPAARAVDVPTPAPEADARLVGRDDEQAAVAAALTAAAAGRTQVVVASGPPGIGKSALAYWACEHARSIGFATASGRAYGLEGAPPFWPWTEALRAVDDGEAVEGDTAMSPVLPELAGASGVPASQFLLFAAVADHLAALASRRPLLVVLDDCQWADLATLDLVRFLARSPRPARVAVLVCGRAVPHDHPFAALEADLVTERDVRAVRLAPLDVEEVGRLVRRLVTGPVDERVVEAIADRTGGNPFFVEELVRVLARPDGPIDVSAAAVPRTVADVVRQRAAPLGEHAVEVLTAASYLGSAFSTAVPALLTGIDVPVVRAVLEAAVEEGLLEDEPGRPGWRRFAHDLVRHAFYDPVAPERRADAHRRVGELLVDLLGERAPAYAAEIAAHLALGAASGGPEEAVRWLRLAAERAGQAVAHDDAVHQLRRALFLVRRELDDPRLECEVLLDLARAARLAADVATATTASARAARLAAELGDQALAEEARSPIFRSHRSSS